MIFFILWINKFYSSDQLFDTLEKSTGNFLTLLD